MSMSWYMMKCIIKQQNYWIGVVGMQRSDKRKMSLPMKILLWVVGILFLLAIIAVIYGFTGIGIKKINKSEV